jgi:nucleotide-binding universal stress UspA family protein
LNTVVVGWDFSRPAARALADALPILEMAKQVRIVTVTNEKTLGTRRSEAVSKHLAAHGLTAFLDTVDAADRSIGEVLESYASSFDADLLVIMGAYGHSRVRDFILGGATKSILARPPFPVLLSH